MVVRELIEALQAMPQDAIVLVDEAEWGEQTVDTVELRPQHQLTVQTRPGRTAITITHSVVELSENKPTALLDDLVKLGRVEF